MYCIACNDMVNVRQNIIITLKKQALEAFYKHSGTVFTFKVRLNHFGYIFVNLSLSSISPQTVVHLLTLLTIS